MVALGHSLDVVADLLDGVCRAAVTEINAEGSRGLIFDYQPVVNRVRASSDDRILLAKVDVSANGPRECGQTSIDPRLELAFITAGPYGFRDVSLEFGRFALGASAKVT